MTLADRADVSARGGPSIAVSYARAFLEFAVARGGDRVALLRASGLSDAALARERLDLPRFIALIDAAIAQTGDPALALRFGAQAPVEKLTIVALITMASRNVREALEQMGRFARLIVDAGGSDVLPIGRLLIEDDGPWLVSTDPVFTSHAYLEQILLAQNVCGATRVMGRSAAPTLIHCRHDAPGHAAEYEEILGAPVVFSSGRFAVRVPAAALELAVPSSDGYAFAALSQRAVALLAEIEATRSVRAAVERALLSTLHMGEPDMADVAGRLGVGAKTLYRRLQREGFSFAEVLDDLRRRLATSLLADRAVSVAEAAYLTGFSEPAAFSRAFKRWTGERPGRGRAGR